MAKGPETVIRFERRAKEIRLTAHMRARQTLRLQTYGRVFSSSFDEGKWHNAMGSDWRHTLRAVPSPTSLVYSGRRGARNAPVRLCGVRGREWGKNPVWIEASNGRARWRDSAVLPHLSLAARTGRRHRCALLLLLRLLACGRTNRATRKPFSSSLLSFHGTRGRGETFLILSPAQTKQKQKSGAAYHQI